MKNEKKARKKKRDIDERRNLTIKFNLKIISLLLKIN